MSLYGTTFDEKKKKSSLYGQTFNPDFKPEELLPLERKFQQPNTAPLPSAAPLPSKEPIKMRSSHTSTMPAEKPDYKSAFIKGTVGSLLGRAATPLVEKMTGRKVDLSTLPESDSLGEKAVGMVGSLGADLPLWLGGDALLAKPLSMLAKTKPIAKIASSFPKISPALGTGVRAGTTFGGPINAVETAMNKDGVEGFTDRLKDVPTMALGGTVLHGGGQILGKGIKSGVDFNRFNSATKLPEIKADPLKTLQSAYKNPVSLRSGTQQQLERTFGNTPNLMEPVKLKPLQRGVDDAVGVRSPLSSQSLAQRESDAQSAFGGPRELKQYGVTRSEDKSLQELQDGIKIAQEFQGGNKLVGDFAGKDFTNAAAMDNIKHYTGVDLPKLMSNYEKAQNVRGPLTQQERIMGRQAGVIPPLKQREGFPIERPSIEPPLPQRILPKSERLTWTNRDVQDAGPLPIRSITADNVSQLPGGMPNSKAVQPITPNEVVGVPMGQRSASPAIVPTNVSEVPTRTAAAAIERNPAPSISVAPVRDLPGGAKTAGAEPIIPDGLTERGVSKNIRTDANRPDALRDSYSVDPLAYKQLGNKETLAKAQDIFDQGFDTARKQVDDLLAKGKPEAAPLTKMLADKLTNEADIVGARDLLSNAANRATEAGQFGQAFRILREADPATFMMTFDKQLAKLNKEGLEQYGKKWKPVDLTPDELTMIGKIEKGNQASYDSAFEKIQARIADEMPATLWEKVTAWRHIAMLLNTTTNIRNVGGNAIMMAMRKAAQKTEGILQKVVSKADRTQSVFVKKEYRQLADDYVEANKKDLLSGANKYQENISLSMPDKRVFAKSRIGEKLGMNIDVLEKTRKFNYALLQKGDDPFFKNSYADRLSSYAQARGIKDFSKLPQEAFDMAKKEALESTYKNANFIADFLNKAKRPGKDAGFFKKGAAIATEIAIPFVKTPLNIMARGAEYTPLSLVTGFGRMVSKKSAMAGISDMAKGMVGSGIVGLGYTLASGGILTGGYSKDKDLREYNKATGNAPFSVMGKYSFDWALPISIPLIIGVELYNSTHKSEEEKNKMDSIISGNDDAKLSEKIMNVLGGVWDGLESSVDATMNMSMLQTVKSLLFNQQGYLEGLKDLPKDFVTQLIPSMVGKIASSVDPIVRTQYVKGDRVTSLKNSAISKVPFASKTLQPKLTPFGGETKRIENPIGRTLANFLSPGIIAKNQGIIPKIDTELKRLNVQDGITKQFPTMVPNYIDKTQTHPRITLTPAETTQYQKQVGELTMNSFQKVMNKRSYLNARPIKEKNKTADDVRADLLSAAIAESKATAKKSILESKGLR